MDYLTVGTHFKSKCMVNKTRAPVYMFSFVILSQLTPGGSTQKSYYLQSRVKFSIKITVGKLNYILAKQVPKHL